MAIWSPPGDSKPNFEEAVKQLSGGAGVRALCKGDLIGTSWTNHWVKVDITLPTELRTAQQQRICELDALLV